MRSPAFIGLMLLVACYVSCRERDPIDPEQKTEDPAFGTAEPGPTSTSISTTEISWPSTVPATTPAPAPAAEPVKDTNKNTSANTNTEADPPIVMGPQDAKPRIESLRFAHASGNLCLQANENGEANLQNCDGKANGQKFLFSRSLDGRLQLKDAGSDRCLAVGASSFFSSTYLVAEVCESKASQFFSVVDYGNNYSLKYDANNTCLDAEKDGANPGTRIILYKCSATQNQKIQVVKKSNG